ncbi:MAG: YitT family protein [Clostridia bacterium]|nr:YitT family protein [Clostridia bacterium]
MVVAERAVRSLFYIVAGTLVLAFGVAAFVVPYELVAGGVTGIAVVLEQIWGGFEVDRTVFLLGWLLFFWGLAVFGRSFALKTLCSTLLYPMLLSTFLHWSGMETLSQMIGTMGERRVLLFVAILGGSLVGLGCALTVMGGGSTGGTDVPVLILCKAFPRLGHGRAFFLLDTAIILLGFAVTGEVFHMICGALSALASACVLGALLPRAYF